MSEKKSYCYKCKREIEVNIPETVTLSDGRKIHGFTSEDHGCGKEYVQFHCKAADVGFTDEVISEMIDGLKDGPIITENGGPADVH